MLESIVGDFAYSGIVRAGQAISGWIFGKPGTGNSSTYLNNNSSNGSLFKKGVSGRTGADDLMFVDADWVRSRCMVPGSELEGFDKKNRRFTTTYWKYTNSALGGNIGINPKPQFTRYADIRSASRSITWNATTTEAGKDLGMGRYYSEAIDDNTQVIHFEFGVPKFNSLLDFFTNAIDYKEALIANEGRSAIWYNTGQAIGAVGMLVAFPYLTLTVVALKLVGDVISIFSPQIHRYYYLKPTMWTYWGAVNTMVTMMATELGILVPEANEMAETATKIGVPVQFNNADMGEMADLFPGLIHPGTNYIDVFKIAARTQMMATNALDSEYKSYKADKNSDSTDYLGYVETQNTEATKNAQGSLAAQIINGPKSFADYLSELKEAVPTWFEPKDINKTIEDSKAMQNVQGGEAQTISNDGNGGTAENTAGAASENQEDFKLAARDDEGFLDWIGSELTPDWAKDFGNALIAGSKNGARFASFYVDYTGSVSDSFSSSTGPIGSETAAKSIAQAGRDFKFMLNGDSLGSTVGAVVGAAKDVVSGALDSMSYGLSNILQTIFGGAYIDMPNKWEDSEANLASISYSMTLISPYNNPISQMINIYIPLAMLMAGSLPLGTGASSYTSPYLCSCFDRGKQHIRLGIISSLSIERGTSNLGFDRLRRPLAIKVNFTVTNLSNALTVPMSNSVFSAFKVTMMDDSPLGEYIATLCGRSHLMSKYFSLQRKLKWSRMLMYRDQALNADAWGLRIGDLIDTLSFGLISAGDARIKNETFGGSGQW